MSDTNKTCQTCRWWSRSNDERMACVLLTGSQKMPGAVEFDKFVTVYTPADFWCNKHEAKAVPDQLTEARRRSLDQLTAEAQAFDMGY